MILQSYDFVELHKRYNCIAQMGGSDQWGNIVMGADLGRRMQGAELFARTSPLLSTASGAKMGKTAAGAVWLNPDRLSPYDFWQYWRNTEDADVGRFLKLFTDMPLSEIAKLEALQGQEINEAKKILATEVDGAGARQAGGRERRRDGAPHRSRKVRRPIHCRPSTWRARSSRPASPPSSCCTMLVWWKAATRRASSSRGAAHG